LSKERHKHICGGCGGDGCGGCNGGSSCALSQAAILLGSLAANPVAGQEAIPAAALAPAVIAEEALGYLAAGLAVVFQVRSHNACGKLFVFDEAEHRWHGKVASISATSIVAG
jgi:hypothetical protein